jgi:SCY1-like protein 2
VEDSKNGIAFTTERIVCSLADILNNFENVPGGLAEHTSFFESGPAISEMEISRGLLNITLAIQYLHTVQRKLHLNITPEDIVITASGQWKLCGFGFALNFIQGDTQRLASPYFMQASPITTTSLVSRLEPDLRYAAPECTDGGFNPPGVRYLTPVADMFALGLVFYEIYR